MTAAAAAMVTLACGSADGLRRSSGAPPAMPASGTGTVEVGGRQVTVHVPGSYDPARWAPLVVGLHGYTSNAKELETYLRLTPESERRGFVYAYPDGSADDRGDRFWNATDACCAFSGPGPDDSRYLSELISRIQGSYRIDRARVYLIGHSNGGVIGGAAFPSAATTVAQWLGYNRCAEAGRNAPELDLVTALPAAETSVRAYEHGCAGESTVQAWTINGGTHVPQLGAAFAPAVTDFLLSQADPVR